MSLIALGFIHRQNVIIPFTVLISLSKKQKINGNLLVLNTDGALLYSNATQGGAAAKHQSVRTPACPGKGVCCAPANTRSLRILIPPVANKILLKNTIT